MHRSRDRCTQHFDTEAPCSSPTTICIIPCTSAVRCSHSTKACKSLHSNTFVCTKPFIFTHVLITPLRAQTLTQYPNKIHPSTTISCGFKAPGLRKHLIAQLTLSLTLIRTHRLRSQIAALQHL